MIVNIVNSNGSIQMDITIVNSPSGRLERSIYMQLGLVEYNKVDDMLELLKNE